MKLNHKKMLEEINKLVTTDFAFDMDCKQMPESEEYTIEEAREMAEIIGKVYSISHCLTCTACQGKFAVKK